VINNATLSNVQKFHYLIASLQNEAKDLISNLHITNENFIVAWQLITQRYDNKRLIAIMHAQQLCHLPELKKPDAASLRQLISHFTSHLNALNAMSLSVTIQDLMLNTLLLASLDPQTQREWELFTSRWRDIPSTTELVSFVEAWCKAVELLQVFQSPRTNSAPTGSSSTRPANPATHKVVRNTVILM
jgi:diphosphomevalonate decarboxylase